MTEQSLTINSPEVQELAQDANGVMDIANAIEIDSDAMYELAGEEIKGFKSKAKVLDNTRKSMTKPLDESKKTIMEFFRDPIAKLKEAEEKINGLMIAYQRKKEAERRAEEKKLREAEEKKRLKEEAAAKKKADKLREEGKEEEAAQVEDDAVEAAAIAPPPVVVADKTPTVKGVHTRKNWKFRITDEAKIPREYLVVDEKKIGQVVRALKENTNIPGVEIYDQDKVVART